MYMCVKGVEFAYFCIIFPIGFCSCSYCVVFFFHFISMSTQLYYSIFKCTNCRSLLEQ